MQSRWHLSGIGPGGEEHWDDSLSDPPPDDHAVLLFQDTMQAFLQTQQAVMTAYLGGSTADAPLPADSNGVSLSSRPSEAVPEPGPWAGEVLPACSGRGDRDAARARRP